MKLFRNKFFFIALTVALALSVFSVTLTAMGRTDVLGGTVRTLTYPIRWVAAKTADAFRGFGRYFGASREQSDEIESLRQALADAKDEAERSAILEAENERLREYLGIREAHPDFRFEEAVVIGRSTEKFAPVLTLNRGSLHGIRVNMPVITPSGLVGYVSSVGLTDCRVRTILSGDLSVSAYIERSGVSGVVSGKIMTDGSGELLCVMEYLESSGPSGNETATETATETDTETAGESGTDGETETVPPGEDYLKLYGIDVRIGDVILSSGAGAVYPAGLRIGKVREVRVDGYSRKLTLVIEPSAELGKDLTYALILTETGSGS